MAEIFSIAARATLAKMATAGRELAIEIKHQTRIEWAGYLWAVRIAPDVRASIRGAVANKSCEEKGDSDDFPNEIDNGYCYALNDEYQHAIIDEHDDIASEMLEAQENWERSEEQGWFYAD